MAKPKKTEAKMYGILLGMLQGHISSLYSYFGILPRSWDFILFTKEEIKWGAGESISKDSEESLHVYRPWLQAEIVPHMSNKLNGIIRN